MCHLVLINFFAVVAAYRDGAPREVCRSMVPGHGGAAQTSHPPYILIADWMGTSYEVILKSKGGANFKGFLIQARDDRDVAFGTFFDFSADVAKVVSCDNSSGAITHKDGREKKSFRAKWKHSGDVEPAFRATVVKTKPVFWVGLTVAPLPPDEPPAFDDSSLPPTEDSLPAAAPQTSGGRRTTLRWSLLLASSAAFAAVAA
jgi:hypothetical protein